MPLAAGWAHMDIGLDPRVHMRTGTTSVALGKLGKMWVTEPNIPISGGMESPGSLSSRVGIGWLEKAGCQERISQRCDKGEASTLIFIWGANL